MPLDFQIQTLGGMRRRAVSEARAVEFEFELKSLPLDFQIQTLGGMRRRAVSGAHAVEFEIEFEPKI